MLRAWRCYSLFFLPRTDYTFKVRLNLELFFSSWWKWKSTPIYCCLFHIYWCWSLETWTYVKPSESMPQTWPQKIQPCSTISCLQHLRNETFKKRKCISGSRLLELWYSNERPTRIQAVLVIWESLLIITAYSIVL